MTRKFHEELDALKEDVLKMGEFVTVFLQKSVEALVNQDVDLAKSLMEHRRQIIDSNNEIEERCIELIALQQPMATDLRTIIAILKIIEDLVRIGRYGKDIAESVDELSKRPHVKKLISIPQMQQIVVAMVTDALNAFKTGDLTAIEDIAERDMTVDELWHSIFRECVSYMIEDPQTITRCIQYVMFARYLERCGDHAVKIAERVHFVYTAERVELR
jgi:phosphate transport system protein